MPGRGRAVKRRRPASPSTSSSEVNRLLEPDRGMSHNTQPNRVGPISKSSCIDFETLIRESGIIPAGCGGQPPSTLTNISCVNDLNEPVSPGLPTCSYSSEDARVFTSVQNTHEQIRLSVDDVAAHVPDHLRQQIRKGEYVNFALLLKGAVELADFCSGASLRLTQDGRLETGPKECKDKITSIEKWTDAFIIFMSIYITCHQERTHELLRYMWNIRECAARQSGFAWRTYDEQFRLRQASALAPWGQINNDLWWRCMLVRDNSGMTQKQSKLKPTCHFFNAGSCTWKNCKFNHLCNRCGENHPAVRCTHPRPAQYNNQSNPAIQPSFRSFTGRQTSFAKQGK